MFRSINKMYYRGVHGVILVCDLFSLESFKELDSWLAEFLKQQDRSNDYTDFAFALMANKSDIKGQEPQVTVNDIIKWCQEQKK